jgi:hypothetical protein
VFELVFIFVELIFEFADFFFMFEGELTVFFLQFIFAGLPVVFVLFVSLEDGVVEFVEFGLFEFVFVEFFFEEVEFLLEEGAFAC